MSSKEKEQPQPANYVICRCNSAGVHAGFLVEADMAKGTAVLKDARRLWRWQAAKGHTLSAVAIHGLDPQHSQIPTAVDIEINGVCEIIQCSYAGAKSIRDCPEHLPG